MIGSEKCERNNREKEKMENNFCNKLEDTSYSREYFELTFAISKWIMKNCNFIFIFIQQIVIIVNFQRSLYHLHAMQFSAHSCILPILKVSKFKCT